MTPGLKDDLSTYPNFFLQFVFIGDVVRANAMDLVGESDRSRVSVLFCSVVVDGGIRGVDVVFASHRTGGRPR